MCDGHLSGRFDAARLDTRPGSGGLLAPPAAWTGDEADYRDIMVERYRRCPIYRQQILAAAKAHCHPRPCLRAEVVSVDGPWQDAAVRILESIAQSCLGATRVPETAPGGQPAAAGPAG